jgi:hypothetical protein
MEEPEEGVDKVGMRDGMRKRSVVRRKRKFSAVRNDTADKVLKLLLDTVMA